MDSGVPKANSTLGFVKWNLTCCPSNLRETVYLLVSSDRSWSPDWKLCSALGISHPHHYQFSILDRCQKNPPQTLQAFQSGLEYAATIWDPYTKSDINSLEMVQRRAARFVKGDFRTTVSVTQMLGDLGWKNLERRRKELRLTLLY